MLLLRNTITRRLSMFAAVLTLCLPAAAGTPDWRYTVQSSEVHGAIDVASISIEGSVRRAWVRVNLLKPRTAGPETVRSSVQRWVADCSRSTFYVAQYVNYSGSNGTGKVVATPRAPSYPTPEEPVPGSVGAFYLEGICSPEKLTVPDLPVPSSDPEKAPSVSSPDEPTGRSMAPRTPDGRAADALARREAEAQAAMWKLIGTKYTTSEDVEVFMGKPFFAKAQVPCVPKPGLKTPERCVEMRWLDGRAGHSALRFWLQVEDTVDQPLWFWSSDSTKR